MSGRGLHPDVITEIEGDVCAPVALVKLEFDGGTVYLHTWTGEIVYDGNTYTGAGALAFIGPIDEDTDLTRNRMQLGLRAIPNDIISIALNENCQDRPFTLYLTFLDTSDMSLIGDPVIFSGTMDNWNFTIGKNPSLTLNVEDEFAILDQADISRFTDADQRARYPDDRFFEYTEQATAQEIRWGR